MQNLWTQFDSIIRGMAASKALQQLIESTQKGDVELELETINGSDETEGDLIDRFRNTNTIDQSLFEDNKASFRTNA